jgi:hypothetical protein
MKTASILTTLLVPFATVAAFAVAGCSDHDHDHAGATELVVTVSGEDTGREGYAFPPASTESVAFVDGWSLTFDHLVVSIGEVTLSDTPDLSPTDQSKTGPVVARAKGPWVIDLAKPGTNVEPPLATSSFRTLGAEHGAPSVGRGSGEDKAVRLVTFENLNVAGKDFDPTVRYALGYSTVPVSAAATKLNVVDAETTALVNEMQQQGAVIAYVGKATWKGTSCTSSDPAYDWSAFPKTVSFKLLFKTPVDLINCQNTDLEGKPFDGEEKQRGVQLKAGEMNVQQLTFHNDHAFWLTADHEAAAPFFDQIAAAAKADGTVTLADLETVDPTAFKDGSGKALPWRSCLASVPAPAGQRRVDTNGFGASFDRSKGPKEALRNYAEAMSYVTAVQGHLNDDGLCAVKRNYDSP